MSDERGWAKLHAGLDEVSRRVDVLQRERHALTEQCAQLPRLRARLLHHSELSHGWHNQKDIDGGLGGVTREACVLPSCVADRKALAGQSEREEEA